MRHHAPSISSLVDVLVNSRSHPYHRYASAHHSLQLLGYDNADPHRLAIRAYDSERQAFIGVEATADDDGLRLAGRCPQCGTIGPMCTHAHGLMGALIASRFQFDARYQRVMPTPFLSAPASGTHLLSNVPIRVREMADIFGDTLPKYRPPLPPALTRMLNLLVDAEVDHEPAETRTARFPEAAQLRFAVTHEEGRLHVRPVYMAPAESHAKLRLVEPDYTGSSRNRQIHDRLTPTERSWLRQIRGWSRPQTTLKSVYQPTTELDQELLAEFITAGRVDLVNPKLGITAPVVLQMGEPVVPHLHWEVTPQLTAQLQLGLPAHGHLLSLPDAWWFNEGDAQVSVIEGLSSAQLIALRQAPVLPREQIAQFADALESSGLTLALPVPQEIPDPEVVEVDPRALVILSAMSQPGVPALPGPAVAADVFFRYGRGRVQAGDARSDRVIVRDGAGLKSHPRVTKKENALVRAIEDLGLRPYHLPRHGYRRAAPVQDGSTSATAISLMGLLRNKGIQVELSPNLGVQVLMDSASETYADIDDAGGAMIGVDAGIVVEGVRLSLVQIAQAAFLDPDFKLKLESQDSDRRIFIPLDDARLVSLPHSRVHELLGPFLEWLASQPVGGSSSRSPRFEVPRAAVLAMAFNPEDDQSAWLSLPGMDALRQTVERLREKGIERVPKTPEGFVGELREYQQVGVRWLNTLAELGLGGCLADDMGLGKTVQLLVHILMRRQERREDPVLVVAPKTVVEKGWLDKLFFVPTLKVLNLTGPDRASRFGEIAGADIVLTNYATFRLDIEQLEKQHWSMVVFDESQNIKNTASQTHHTANRLQVDRIMVVSGTPIENHLAEFYGQMSLALPGLFGSSRDFTKFYRTPIEKHGDDEARLKLRRRFAPFLLRRLKVDVLNDLPEKTDILRTVILEPEQQKVYDVHKLAASRKVWDALHTGGLAQAHVQVIQQLQRLQMICCHPSLLRDGSGKGGSAKLTEIMEIVDQIISEGRRVVIVSQYVRFLELIGLALAAKGITSLAIYGKTKHRSRVQEQFQAGDDPVMLLSLKAGGVGIDLTAADNVIIASPWWNPAAERQAIDRTHRIGQVNPVFAYRVVSENTIEVEVLSRQSRKDSLARSILDDDGDATEAALTLDDVVALFGVDPLARRVDKLNLDTTAIVASSQEVYPDNPYDDDGELELDTQATSPEPLPALPPPVVPSPAETPGAASAPKPATAHRRTSHVIERRGDLARWLRQRIHEKGASIADLNRQLGKTGQWLANRLTPNGNTRMPLEELATLTRLLGVSVPPDLQQSVEDDWRAA